MMEMIAHLKTQRPGSAGNRESRSRTRGALESIRSPTSSVNKYQLLVGTYDVLKNLENTRTIAGVPKEDVVLESLSKVNRDYT